MLKIKIIDLLHSEIAFSKIKSQLDSDGFEFTLAYKLTKLLNKISSELTEIYKQREKFLKKYGEEDKNNPGTYILKNNNSKEATKIWDKFVNTEVELSGVKKLTKDEVTELGKLTTAELISILPFTEVEKIDFDEKSSKFQI